MAPVKLSETPAKNDERKLSSLGATEDLMDIRGALAQRIDRIGSKIEDLAGTGEIDSSGG